MATSQNIRLLLRELRQYIDILHYQETLFSIAAFELYVSGDAAAEGDEYLILMDRFEDLLNELYSVTQNPEIDYYGSLEISKVDELFDAISIFLGSLGYDWDYQKGIWA